MERGIIGSRMICRPGRRSKITFVNGALREKLRMTLGREAEPTAVIIDSQTVKTPEKGCQEAMYHAGKQIQGRKRAGGMTRQRHLNISNQGKVYRQMGISRAYYSCFGPVMDTPFENLNATLPIRELRRYQSSFLLRDYGWNIEELLFEGDGNLRLDVDPKRAWIDIYLRQKPLDVMRAERADLMRVPGLGPKGADAILLARRQAKLTDLAQLRAIGIRVPEQATPYILLDGRRPPLQLSLF